jgi:hypothetical protein
MKRTSLWGPAIAVVFLLAAGATPGCSCSNTGTGTNKDLGNHDGGGNGDGPIFGDGGLTACGDNDPSCMVTCVGPTCMPPGMFPLPSDSPPPANVGADGVNRDPNGYIILDSTHAAFDYLWIADDMNYNVGLVSKVSTKPATMTYPNGQKYGEVARYVTFTCQSAVRDSSGNVQSNPTAGKEGIVLGTTTAGTALCKDGHTGCCSWDQTPSGPNHIGLNPQQNRPSRTAVDFNGDVWVANRAFGYQQSVTKIANSMNDCIERNGIPGIQTSSDVNNDGVITTDCDGNNLPDDASTVCTNGRAHEFYGLDDECILFTTAYGAPNSYGRPLALGPAMTGPDPTSSASDAWAGTWQDGATGGAGSFFRISGSTGKIITQVPLSVINGHTSHPYGAAIDSFGILWAPTEATGDLFYFDTNAANPAAPANQGVVTETLSGSGFYGISVDGYKDNAGNLIQQVWMGNVGNSGAYRYRPVRNGTFAGLGTGTWSHTQFTGAGAISQGRGIGVDNRSPTSFVWVALDALTGGGGSGGIGKIPFDIGDGEQTLSAATNVFPTTANGTLGAGVAIDLDIWGINQSTSSATHFSVDPAGNVTPPTASDQVTLDDNPTNPNITKPLPYTYSDFTGFGLRNFTNPHGTYDWTQTGCGPMRTHWLGVVWDAETTPGVTNVTMKARSADSMAQIPSALFTQPYPMSPADLTISPGPVSPNPSGFLDVEFILTTTDKSVSPKLKSFQIIWECINGIG